MIRQAGRHSWRTRLPQALSVIDLDPQGLDRAGQVIRPIFPGTALSLEEGKRLPNQPTVHLPGCQMRALDVGGMLTQQGPPCGI